MGSLDKDKYSYWLGKQLSEEHRNKISNSMSNKRSNFQGKKHTEQTKQKIRAARAKQPMPNPKGIGWCDRRAMISKPNKKEILLHDFLQNKFPNTYMYVGDGQFILAGKFPDFVRTDGINQIIELYGDYWHRNDDPQDRIDLFKQFGYSTLVIWEHELVDYNVLEERTTKFYREGINGIHR